MTTPAQDRELLEQAYIRLANGEERIIDLPDTNAKSLSDTDGSYDYGNQRIVKYVHSSCRGFSKLKNRLRGTE